jgi:DNA-binding response OmpR family regulator
MGEAGQIPRAKDVSGNSAPLRVLIVDDSEACAKTMGWALELMGYDIRLATDAANGLAAALDQKPDIFLLDLGMPGLNGYDLCRLMRKEYGFTDALFIAQTGWKDEEHRNKAREAGFDYYMVKPVDMARLGEVIKTHMSGAGTAQPTPC